MADDDDTSLDIDRSLKGDRLATADTGPVPSQGTDINSFLSPMNYAQTGDLSGGAIQRQDLPALMAQLGGGGDTGLSPGVYGVPAGDVTVGERGEGAPLGLVGEDVFTPSGGQDLTPLLQDFNAPLKSSEQASTGIATLDTDRAQDASGIIQSRQRQTPAPTFPSAPQTPENMVRRAMGAFANPLMWLAIAGGAMTKRPAINALTAAAGLMKGMNQKDFRKAYLQQHKFRNSVKELDKQVAYEQQQYGEILNDPNLSTEDKLNQLRPLADAFQDPHMKGFLDKNDLGSAQQLWEGREKLHPALKKAQDGYTQAGENLTVDLVGKGQMDPPPLNSAKNRAFMAQVQRKYPNYNPETDSPRAKRREDRLTLKQAGAPSEFDETKPLPKLEGLAVSYANGNWRAASGLSKPETAMVKSRGAWLADHPTELAEAENQLKGPGLSGRTKEFAGGMTAAQTAGRIEGRIVSALSRAEAAAPIVINLSERVNRSEFPDLNSILLSAKQRIGNVSVPEFRTALQTLVLNYAQAIGGGAQGAVTVDAAKHARELLDISFSKGQVRGTVRQMLFEINRELAGAKRGVGIVSGTEQPAPKDREQEAYEWAIQNLSDPKAQEILKRLGL